MSSISPKFVEEFLSSGNVEPEDVRSIAAGHLGGEYLEHFCEVFGKYVNDKLEDKLTENSEHTIQDAYSESHFLFLDLINDLMWREEKGHDVQGIVDL